MPSAKVSILIPAYNAQSTIHCALASLQRQTFSEFEIVVVDDGSTDDTAAILHNMARNELRLKVINTSHSGIVNALNVGIGECRGELVARMDADDVCHRRRLELQAGLMDSRPDVSVCSSCVRMFPRSNLSGGLASYEGWLNSLITSEQIARDIFVESPVAHPTAMMRRQELLGIGGYEEHGWPEDYDLWLRYHVAGRIFAKVDSALLFWRHGADRLTFTDSRYSVENFLRAKAHYLALMLEQNLLRREVVMWGAGQMGRRLCKHLQREGVAIGAVVSVEDGKIGTRMRGAPVVGVDYLEDGPEEKYVIAAVSSEEVRGIIRGRLASIGFVEGRDFVCAA